MPKTIECWRVPTSGWVWTPDDDPDFPGGVHALTPGPLLDLLRVWVSNLNEAGVLRCIAGCGSLGNIGGMPLGVRGPDDSEEIYRLSRGDAHEHRLVEGWSVEAVTPPTAIGSVSFIVRGIHSRPVLPRFEHRRAVVDGITCMGKKLVIEPRGDWTDPRPIQGVTMEVFRTTIQWAGESP